MKLAEIIKNYHINQTAMAEDMGVKKQFINDIIKGNVKCNEKRKFQIISYIRNLGTTLSEISIDF